MNTIHKKIWNFIQTNQKIKENLFLFSDVNEKYKNNYSLWTGNQIEKYKDIQWLYISQAQQAVLIGINKDNKIVAIDDEGLFVDVCQGLENIPYEFLRIECAYTENENTDDYFIKDPSFKNALNEYEQWCKKNDIVLDQEKVYHDNHGEIFQEYFEKN